MIRWQNGWYFEQLADGAVRLVVEVRNTSGHVTEAHRCEIPAQQWHEIVGEVTDLAALYDHLRRPGEPLPDLSRVRPLAAARLARARG